MGCWGFAEADAGSDPGGIRTRAVRDGDHYVVNGAKMFITNGTFADFAVVTVSPAPEQGMKGLSLLIVDRGPPGFRPARRPEPPAGQPRPGRDRLRYPLGSPPRFAGLREPHCPLARKTPCDGCKPAQPPCCSH